MFVTFLVEGLFHGEEAAKQRMSTGSVESSRQMDALKLHFGLE
jgi:hypothetical protein